MNMIKDEDETYDIILNSTNLVNSASNNIYTYNFPAGGVKFKNTKIAVSDINIYYSWYNISASIGNNTFSIIWPTLAGTTTYNITIPDSFYTAQTLNAYMQSYFITNGLYLVNSNSQNVYYWEVITNPALYAININEFPLPTSLPSGYSNPGSMTFPATTLIPQTIINNNNFQYIVGLIPATYPASPQTTVYSINSNITPQLTPVQSIIVTCDAINNKYANPTNIIYSFGISNTTFGSELVVSPYYPKFITAQDGNHSSLTITFLDQNFNPLNIRDSNILIQLTLKTPLKGFIQ